MNHHAWPVPCFSGSRRLPCSGNPHNRFPCIYLCQAIAESSGEGSSGGGAGSHWDAAAAAVGNEQRRAAKRQLDEWEEEEEEEDEFMQRGVLESLRCSREAEEAALQRALLAAAQEGRSGAYSSWRQQCSKRAGGVPAGLQADDESPAVQQALLESLRS